MAREKYQVLVLPYRITPKGYSYCVLLRSDMNCWQFVSGGGETEDGSILVSAKREAFEEAGIPTGAKFSELEARCSIPTECFSARADWGKECLVIPQYSFAVDCTEHEIQLSAEHTAFEWLDYESAVSRLRFDSNKVALWELDNKLKMGLI